MTDRLRDAVEAVLVAMLPTVLARTLGTLIKWEYQVVSVTPGPPVKISGKPVGASPYGTLADIVLWPGPSGGYAIPPVGSLILVEFHDGTPSKPAIAGLDPSTPPTLTTFAGGTEPIALGDLVTSELTKIAATLLTGSNSGGPVAFATSYTPGNVSSTKVVSG